jgi:hypothetical protein
MAKNTAQPRMVKMKHFKPSFTTLAVSSLDEDNYKPKPLEKFV